MSSFYGMSFIKDIKPDDLINRFLTLQLISTDSETGESIYMITDFKENSLIDYARVDYAVVGDATAG